MDQHKNQSLQCAERNKDEGQIRNEMQGEKQDLDPAIFPCFLLRKENSATDVQAIGFKKQEREEEEALIFDDKAWDAAFFESGFFTERYDRDVNIRVHILLVGMGVMLVVLVHPPAITHPDQQVGVQEAEKVILFRGVKSLSMAGIVG